MTNDELTQFYEAPNEWSAEKVEETAAKLLQESNADVIRILTDHGVPKDQAQAIATETLTQGPKVDYKGSGSTAEVIAIAVSLAPLIKVLTPLLKPFADRGARLAYEIGSDIWKMLRNKLLHEKSVRIYEKRSSSPKRK